MIENRFKYAPAITECALMHDDDFGMEGFDASTVYNFLNQQIPSQIFVICRNEGKTATEIAETLGINEYYIQDYLNKAEEYQLIEKNNNKYLTSFCVYSIKAVNDAFNLRYKTVIELEMPKKFDEAINSVEKEIRSVDFYGNNFEYKRLKWNLYHLACRMFEMKALDTYCTATKTNLGEPINWLPLLRYRFPDEEINWSENLQTINGLQEDYSSFNTAEYGHVHFNDDFVAWPFTNKGSRKQNCSISEGNFSLLMELTKNPNKKLTENEQKIADEWCKHSIVTKSDGGYKVELPVFTRNAFEKIAEILSKAVSPLLNDFVVEVGKKVCQIILPTLRPNDKKIEQQFLRFQLPIFMSVICELYWYGLNNGGKGIPKPLEVPSLEAAPDSSVGLYFITD